MEFALARLLLLALCSFGVSFAAINLDIRTRGVPKSDTNEGNRFCFSFITNKEPVDNLRVLTIFIGTQERESVQYRIRSGTPNVSRNGTVSPGEIIQEQFYDSNMQTDTGSVRERNDLTGIIVETVNSSQKIAVSGFNDAAGSSEGFAAVPMFNVSSFTKSYNYTIFADGPESPVSAMVACGHIAAGGVTIDNTSPTTVRPRGGYFRSRVRNGQTVSSSIDFEEYYNPVLTNNDDEISGLRVFATVPIGFMVGHECGEIPLGKLNCDHLLEQMPPSYTWGYNFLIAPYHSRYAGYIVKVLGGYKTDTNFRLFCDNGTAIAVDNYVDIQSRTPNKGVFDITTQSFCTIQSNRPLAVIQYAKGHDVDDDNPAKVGDLADPQMTWVPSVSQYLNRYLMSNNVSSRPDPAQHFSSNGLYVTVLPECFNASAILDNGTPIERDTSKWSRFYCDNSSDVCGYGISVEVSQARHLLRHTNSRCTFGAVMFGWGNQKGYGFPAGFGMAPVGVPVYSIEPLIASAVEGSTGPVSVTVYKSGDISQASSVVISTFSSSKSNAATIGQDLVSQTRTVNFAPGQSSANVAFTFSDDTSPETTEVFVVGFVDGQEVAIGTPSAAELGIIDDDAITMRFDPVTYSVTEGDGNVAVGIRVVTSQPVRQATTIRIFDIPAVGQTNQATRNVDYQSFDENFVIPAGQSNYTYMTTILSNSEREPTEWFSAAVQYVSGSEVMFMGPNASVAIMDTDVITMRFDPVTYNVTEGDGNVAVGITVVTSQPVPQATTIRIFDIPAVGQTSQATRNVDYQGFAESFVIPAGQSSYTYMATILSNPEREPTEWFSAAVQYVSGSELMFMGPNASVAIMDTDVPTIRFNPIMYSAIEGSSGMSVTVTLSAVTSQPISGSTRIRIRDVATPGAANSATSGSDYRSFDEVITLSDGAMGFSYNVTILSDSVSEALEQFNARMEFASGSLLTVTGPEATINITEDIALSFSSGNYEVPENSRMVNITVIASRPVPSDTVIRLTDIPQPGQASNVTDYASNFTTITIPSGQRSASFIATIFDDETPEPTETFMVGMSIVSGSMVAVSTRDSRTTVTITDSDRSTIRYAPPQVERFEEDGFAPLRIVVEPPYFETFMFESFSVPFQDGNDLAISDTDYESFRRTLTATNGAGPIDSSVILINDSIMEDIEEFGIRLNVTSSVRVDVHPSVASAKVVINDRDRISVGFREPRYVFTEPETQNIVVEIQADARGIAAKQFSCDVEYTDGTAIGGGEDYDEGGQTTQTATFPPGTNTSTVIRVTLNPDDLDEFTEEFTATLKGSGEFANRIDFFRQDTIIEITDSDVVNFYVNTSLSTTNVPESQNARICVQRSGRTVRNYTLNLQPSTIPGGAQSSDFSTAPISFVFRPGDTTICRSVPVVDDTIALEGNETFAVNLTSTTPGFMTTTPSVNVTIRDNDVSMVFFESSRYVGTEGEKKRICLNITNEIARPADVSISVGPAPGYRPLSGQDTSPPPTSVRFNSASKQQCFDMDYNTDTIYEGTEGGSLIAMPRDGLRPGNPISTTLIVMDANVPTIVPGGNTNGTGPNVRVLENETAIVCIRLSGGATMSTALPITFTFTPTLKPGAPNPASPQDFDNTPKTVTMQPGETEACVRVSPRQDTIDDEPDEQFCVNVTSNNSAVVFQPRDCQIMVTIVDSRRCVRYLADIMIVADESTSINQTFMIRLKEFVLALAEQFPVSDTQTHVGVMRFSTPGRTRVDIKVNQITNKTQLITAINNIPFERDGRGARTYHMLAMMTALEELQKNGRKDVDDVIILVTDGLPQPPEQSARSIAAEARKNGTTIYGVFVGIAENGRAEIRNISDRAFEVDDFNALGSIVNNVTSEECQTATVKFTVPNVEVHESAGKVEVCIQKDRQSREDVRLLLYTKQRNTPPVLPDDAREVFDYPREIKNITFARDSNRECYFFNITDDDIGEPTEHFQIMMEILSSPDVAVVDNPIANITILDDDDNMFMFTSEDYCVKETDRMVTVCVKKTRVTEYNLDIDISAVESSPPSALNFFDFISTTKSLTFPGNSDQVCTTFQITVDPVGLARAEGNETFRVTFTVTGALGGGATSAFGRSIVTIKDEGAQVNTIDPKSGTNRTEVPESQGNVTVCVNRNVTVIFDTNVTFTPLMSTSGDKADPGRDYDSTPITVPFPRNDLSACATIKITDDNIVEKNETFLVNMTVPGHVPPTLQTTVLIVDDDTAEIKFASSMYTYRETVGNGSICVETTKALSTDADIRMMTDSTGATANANDDYTPVDQTMTINSGSMRVCYSVPIIPDSINEPTEFFWGRFQVTNMDELVQCYGSRVTVRSSDPAQVFIEDVRRSECEQVEADLVILIDESSSISPFDFIDLKEFANQILRQFPISDNRTHAGIIRFSNRARTQVVSPLGNVTNSVALQRIVTEMSTTDAPGGFRGFATHHKDAMNLAIMELQQRGRANAQEIIILLTDGIPEEEGSSVKGAGSNQSAINASADARGLGYSIFAVGIFGDARTRREGTRELNSITGDPDRVTVLGDFGALNASLSNLTSEICPNDTVPQCIIRDTLTVVPFHPPSNPNVSYNFHGICEHIISKPCDSDRYLIVGDFLAQNLTMGRVGIQTRDGYSIIHEDLSVHSSDPPPTDVTVEGTTGKVTLSFNGSEAVVMRTAESINIQVRSGVTCGLCGRRNGTLVSAGGDVLDDVMNQTKVNNFTSSWQRAPSDQILRDDRRECAVIKNDTIIGDPLFEAALWVGDTTCEYSLCYEIHGSANQHYNLLSDLCVSVNALYTPMRNPDMGNIISAIGIRASGDSDQCHLINIVQDQSTGHCRTMVNNTVLSVGGSYERDGISVRQRMATRVRIGVPNCERVPLIMWVTCQNMSGELMMRFDISRAVNLRPSSHGLLGQFYNIRMQAERYTERSVISMLDPMHYNIDNLWVISVTPPSGSMRSFVAELYERAWDNSRSPCLYAGNSQGGPSIEFAANHTDPVIEGHYTHYRVDSRFGTDFRYKKFDDSRCN